jgi:beta-lactamase superfamily II metal-dependent hydrolase
LNILDLIDNVNFEKTNTEGFMLAAMLSFNADNEHSQAIADLMFLHADPQVYPQYVYSSLMSFLPKPSDVSLSKSELILHDVKQGCFCEIRKDDRPYVIFDAGTEVLRTDAPFFSLLNDLKSAIGQQPLPIMVLSHWHTDHYSLLFSLRDNELQQIEHAYVPTAVKHASIDLLIHRLAFNSKYITVVPDPAPSNRKDVQLNNCLHLYANKVRKSVTNNSGLILFAQGSNNSVLFPGDCNYQYAERAANDSNTSSVRVNYHYLVVPHHGGKAGVVRYKVTNANFVNALVSVGPNKPHNHPFDSVLNQLLNDVSSIEMTKYHGDISKPL